MNAETLTSPKHPSVSGSFSATRAFGGLTRQTSLLDKLVRLWHRWDSLQVSFIDQEPLRPAANAIRASVLVANPGTRPNQIVRVSATVQDQNRTFTLQTESTPVLIPNGSGLAIEVVASNFQPLRLSRECIFRVTLTDRDGKIYRAQHPVANVWSKEMFPDERDEQST